jgi:hypothetical protein
MPTTALNGQNTFASLTIAAPNYIFVGGSQTITGALAFSGTSSTAVVFLNGNVVDQTYTFSLGAPVSASWVVLRGLVTSGGNPLTATNCINLGQLTLASGGSCTGPVVGGSCPGRIIGGENKYQSPIRARGQLASVC